MSQIQAIQRAAERRELMAEIGRLKAENERLKNLILPTELTAENGAKAALMGEFTIPLPRYCPECEGDERCAICRGSGEIVDHVNVPWTTIKEIYKAAIDHFRKQPRQR